MNKLPLRAQERKIKGRKVQKLRGEGILPANVYGKKIKSRALQVDLKEFLKVYKEAKETGLVELAVDGEKKPVLIHNVQMDPVSDAPIHIDFLQVDLKEKVTANVPLEIVGESPAEKQGLGTVVQYIDEIEVEALPADLPEKFELNLSSLTEVDQSFLVKDLPIDIKKVELKVNPDQIMVKVEPPRKPEEELPLPPAEGEEPVPEEADKEKKEEGEEVQQEEVSTESQKPQG